MTLPSALTHKTVLQPETPPVVVLSAAFKPIQPMMLEYWREWGQNTRFNQLSLCIPEDVDPATVAYRTQLEMGCGSFGLLDSTHKDRQFTKPIIGTEFVLPVLDFLTGQGYKWCRPMIRCLEPKTCLSYHRDDEAMRVHMPLQTHKNAFFVVNDKVYRMPDEGVLYGLKTNLFHTAVNAHLMQQRIHFTVTAYKE